MSVYYFLPLAMLSFNYSLILQILFAILIGMIIGLALLAFNLQRFLEIALTYVMLFWEKESMRIMIVKNLTAHKMRNKMTSIIYSISLGFTIFLVVVYNLQLKVIEYDDLQRIGSYFAVRSNDFTKITPELFDPILQAHAENITDFVYISTRMEEDAYNSFREILASDNSRIVTEDIDF